jgi:hypothetical protein
MAGDDPGIFRRVIEHNEIKSELNIEPDEVMVQIGRALEMSQRGQRCDARTMFIEIWEAIIDGGDPFHRCALAHSMADVQDDPGDELMWDLRALEAADLLTDERVEAAGVAGSARAFYPSLHLNLADVYRRIGHRDKAREHIALGLETLGSLDDDSYRRTIRDALERVERKLAIRPSAAS